MKQKPPIPYDPNTQKRFPHHDYYDYQILRPLLQSMIGSGLLSRETVEANIAQWQTPAIRASVKENGMVPLEYLPHSNNFWNIAINLRRAMETKNSSDANNWRQRIYGLLRQTEADRIEAEEIIKLGGALFEDRELEHFRDIARLTPINVYVQLLKKMMDPALLEYASIEVEPKEARMMSDGMDKLIDKALAEGKESGRKAAEEKIQKNLEGLESSDPKRLAYADALAAEQVEGMEHSGIPGWLKAGLLRMDNPQATFQERLRNTAAEADKHGGAKILQEATR